MLVALIVALLSAPLPAASQPHPSLTAAHTARKAAPERRVADPRRSQALFSLHARRTFAAYLRIRLLEMREEGLDRAARAVEGSLPVRELLAPQR